jgi:hypothetical protein
MEKIDLEDDDAVLRRIPNKPSYIKENGKISSGNFTGANRSVYIERLTTIEAVMANHEDFGLARLTVKQITDCGCEVVHDPKPGDYAHAIIPKNHSKLCTKIGTGSRDYSYA